MAIPKLQDYDLPNMNNIPPNKVNWEFKPDKAVLLIHDMQYYFVNFWDKNSPMLAKVIDNINILRQFSRLHGIPIYYTAQPKNQSHEERALLNDIWGAGLVNSPEQQPIIEALSPHIDDIILPKWRYSAFQRSLLEQQMREGHRNQLIIVGIYAHIGCMVTAIDAFMHDIKPFFVADAMADFSRDEHLMSLNYIAGRAGCVLMTNDLLQTAISKEALRTQVLSLLDDSDFPLDDENLIDYGLDSIQIMSLASNWRKTYQHIDFISLAKEPSINAWWSLLSQKM
ncbi:isochorismatase family protein [Providencia manganoxydans]|uniref:isochorismatase family protein n=1 Tax=Providencia manganoxydans TaxID=2923283 RepID=UPI0034E3DBF2